jgi:ABC-type multidrug transport system ATPase subunit
MNYPTENYHERDVIRNGDATGRVVLENMLNTIGLEDVAVDHVPIRVEDLEHRFPKAIAFTNVSLEFAQGKLHLLTGRRGTGKTTLLRLLASRIIKHSDSHGSLIVPMHLRVLHVSKDPLFFEVSLYDNLTYGVLKGDKDGRIERVVEICKALGIQPNTIRMISDQADADVAKWSDVLSRSDCQLLHMVRGVVTNPEVLCIHKPSMGLGPNTVPVVFKMLQTFVKHRGVCMDKERYFFRRPRTCIYTFNRDGDEVFADRVHDPFRNSGP